MLLQNQIYVMRHGQSENNVLGLESCRFETQTRFGLTGDGRAQVLAAAANAPKFDIVYSSPFRRAIETAQIMAESQALTVEIEPALHEFLLPPQFDQRPYEEAEVHIHCPTTGFNHQAPPNGESFDLLHQRVSAALQSIDQQHTQATILLVSHGSPIEALMQTTKGVNTGFGAFEDLPKNAELIHLNSLGLVA